MGLTLIGGSGGGGASPEDVRAIMADTLVPGAGITIDPAGDQLQVASTVGVTTVIRPWAPADLLYATPFDAGVPTWVTAAVTNGTLVAPNVRAMTDSVATPRPAYSTALHAPSGAGAVSNVSQVTALAISAIPQVAGKSVTQVVIRHSLQRLVAGALTGTIAVDGVTRVRKANPTTDTGTPWETLIVEGSVSTIDARVSRSSSAGPTQPSGWFLAGLEVYGNAQPWMLNDVAAYQGNLWRSMQDNNPHVPGSGQGWQQV